MKLSNLEKSGLGLILFWVVVNLYFVVSYPEDYKLNGELIPILGLMFIGVGYRNRWEMNKKKN